MGFYYSSGQPPDKDEKPGGFKETLLIIWAVFSVLAVPFGLMFAGIAYLVILFFMFSASVFLGLAWIGLLVAVIAARGVWEAKHPPDIH
ncbi:hypothetical protein AYO38_05130 [bacterium SCGC AG-212-C10]|nr:hypothetical protein AYO38_05130 [bacterium SCGC AG-212-C10]